MFGKNKKKMDQIYLFQLSCIMEGKKKDLFSGQFGGIREDEVDSELGGDGGRR